MSIHNDVHLPAPSPFFFLLLWKRQISLLACHWSAVKKALDVGRFFQKSWTFFNSKNAQSCRKRHRRWRFKKRSGLFWKFTVNSLSLCGKEQHCYIFGFPSCSIQENKYGFGMTWGWPKDDRFFIFAWQQSCTCSTLEEMVIQRLYVNFPFQEESMCLCECELSLNSESNLKGAEQLCLHQI